MRKEMFRILALLAIAIFMFSIIGYLAYRELTLL